MTDIFDLSRKIGEGVDEYSYYQGLSSEQIKRNRKRREAVGLESPSDDGFFGELADRSAGAFIGALEGVGATANELGLGSGMQDYFRGVLNRNQQWNTPEEQGIAGYIGGAIGNAAGSAIGTIGASIAGGVIGTAAGGAGVGTAAGLTAGWLASFGQTFGKNIQRNRDAGYSESKAHGMAFLESGVDATIENLPFGIVGKSGKLAVNAGRLSKISAAGKRELLNKVGKKMAAEIGQQKAQNLLFKWGKQAAVSGLGESGEEGLQYLNSYLNRELGGDPNAEFSINELADAMAQGFIGGFGLGGVMSAPGIRHEARMRKLNAAASETTDSNGQIENINATTAVPPTQNEAETVQPVLNQLVEAVAEDFGMKVDYIDNYQGKTKPADGFFDKETNTIYLDRQDGSVDLDVAFGHEVKHFLDKNHPELVKTFDELWQQGQTEEGKAFFEKMAKDLGIKEPQQLKEFSAEAFGKILARPETMKEYAARLEQQSPGMGERFVQAMLQFIATVKKRLAGIYVQDPDADALFNNVQQLEQEVANILVELKRKNGNSTQVENVVGAKGNTNVETVPVSAINVDAERFQFKSNTSKTSGVDESNKLGGDWDARTAGNLYLWEDKSGKLYVVNGHHRLELAQRNKVENINAIIDRESDGVTAEQARRNGVLINIRDGQGEVRDYASFIRSEKLSEKEAEEQGVTARKKGRAGYLLGKAGDTLYEAYVNDVIPESKAVIIAEIAQGNEAVEYAGLKLATDRKLSGEVLRQTLKLAAENSSGKKHAATQDSLFDMVDDSVLQEWEAIGKLATKHIDDLREKIKSRKSAVKNPEAAREGDIKVGKKAEKLLSQAQQELARWENYATDAELMAQLREEAGINNTVNNEPVQNVAENVPVENETTERFLPESDTPLLTPKEEADAFSLTSDTTAMTPEQEAVADDKAQKQMEADAAANTMDLPFAEENQQQEDKTVDDFLIRFRPKMMAIIKKNKIAARGNQFNGDLKSAAMLAAAKAYESWSPENGASLDAYASKAVDNAVKSANRKQRSQYRSTGGMFSLDAPNEQGNTLMDTVPAETETRDFDRISAHKNPQEALYRIKKHKFDGQKKQVMDMIEAGLAPYEVGRELGIPTESVHATLAIIKDELNGIGIDYRQKRGTEKENIKEVNRKFNEDLERQASGTLPKGYVHQLGLPGDILLSTGVPNLPIELSSTRLAEKSKQENHPFNIADLKDLPRALQDPVAVFAYGNPTKAQNIIVEIQSEGKNFLVGLSLDSNFRGISVNDIRGLFPKETAFWLRWIQQGKALYLNKEKVQNLIAQQRTNLAEVSDLDLNSIDNIIQNLKNANDNLDFRQKRLRQQINPVLSDGKVRDEYADLLEKKGITPEKIKEWSDKAIEWILSRGGIVNAAQEILANKSPASAAVAELARRHILNSDVFVDGLTKEDRTKLYEIEIDARSEWGRAGRAMQINALNLKDVASVQALLNKLHKDIPPAELQKLRNDIEEKTGIDIFNLSKDIVDDKPKLDAVLRAELSHKAKWHDKVYEYWINSILSGPTTHFANFLGNTANAVYELGIKRFTEALVNTVARRKDGATFGEFREMWKAFNIRNAGKAFVKALDMELLDPFGKFLENNMVAIGGKTGRVIRMPGRLLKAADAFAKAIIEPAETAAYAYRMGIQEGLTGTKLQEYIQKQLTDKDSKAYEWAKERAKELTFQQDPGIAVKRLMAAKESGGVVGAVLKLLLPFAKTPSNILRQGVRKSILGSVNLARETVKGILGKRDFDGEYVARVAEQIIAWGIFMTVAGLSDDDDQPWITGSSASYGSAEYAYNADKIPPYSIRIGDSWYSYARIEPFATGLALMADSIKAYNNIKNGKEGTAVLKDIFNSGKQIILEKSFLNGLGEINKATQDPESFTRVVTNPAKGLVPNLFTQTRNAFIKNAPDNKSREKGAEWLKDQFWIATNQAGITSALPKVDYFGRDVQKDDWGDGFFSPVWRLTSFKRIKADSTADPAEQLIWNYNQRNPNETYYPSLPRNSFTVNGEKYYFTGKTYHDFAVDAGELAHRQIGNAIKAGMLNINNPTEKDIELIKNIFTRARKETQQKYKHKAEKEK